MTSPRPKRRSLRIPEAIDDVIARSGEDRFAPARRPLSEQTWKEAVGVRVAERAKPISLERGVLVVRTATSVWATELSMLSDSVIERLRAKGLDVTELRFRVGNLDPPPRPPERRATRAVPASAPLPARLAESIAEVHDGDLKGAIAQAARANLAWQAHTRPALSVSAKPPAARAPRSAGTESDWPGHTSEAVREETRYTHGAAPRRRT